MEAHQLSKLLEPFLRAPTTKALPLNQSQIENISNYVDLLLRWNARVNLTAVRRPEEVVTRHFGESLFVARHLFPSQQAANEHLIDLGSGAGFPGLPIKIWAPELRLTLIESNQKKATFLREVVRKLALTDVEVFSHRAESYSGQADVVTLRAVERFEQALPVAIRLLTSSGQIALMVGEGQVARVPHLASGVVWRDPLPIPLSTNRVLLIGRLSS